MNEPRVTALAASKQCSSKHSIGPGEFDAVFTVLGTNDIPKVTANQARWHKIEDAMKTVLKGLKCYLRNSSSQLADTKHSSASRVPLFVTAPF